MAFCQSCGQLVAEGWRYCRNCGSDLQSDRPDHGATRKPNDVGSPQRSVPKGPNRSRILAAVVASVVALALIGGSLVTVLKFTRHTNRSANSKSPSAASSPLASANSSTKTFAQLFAQENSGVVRIQATSCGADDIGTGFLIAPDLVATVAHVVQNSVTIALTTNGQTTTGAILGIDTSQELALVRADHALSGHLFVFAPASPQVGEPVAAMGYPEGLPITFTQGTVSGLGRVGQVSGSTLTNLIQTDTAINPGNSGGPLINTRGEVTGLVDSKRVKDEGIGYAISAASAAPILRAWEQNKPQAPAFCSTPVGPPGQGRVPAPSDPDAASIAATLSMFFNAINEADYQTAWEQFTPAQRYRVSLGHLANDDATSFVFDARLRDLTRVGPTTIVAYVTFTSIQAPGYGPSGETCDRWTLDYTMRLIGISWRIDRSGPHHGATHSVC